MSDKNRENSRNKLLNELERQIPETRNSEPEFEEVPDLQLSRFNDRVEEIPHVKNKAYFMEFCNWLFYGYKQLFMKYKTMKN